MLGLPCLYVEDVLWELLAEMLGLVESDSNFPREEPAVLWLSSKLIEMSYILRFEISQVILYYYWVLLPPKASTMRTLSEFREVSL